MMDGVSCSTSRGPESFKRQSAAADTLNRLATFIARAESKPSLRSHKQRALPYSTCQECGQSFPHANDLLEHQEIQHTLPKPHRCTSCGKEFSLRSSLQLHKCEDSSPHQHSHGDTCSGPAYATRLTKVSGADSPTDSLPHCQAHMLDSSPYTCAPCGKGFNQKQALLHHQQAGCNKTMSPPCIDNASNAQVVSPLFSEGESSPSNSLDIPGSCGKTENVCTFCSRTFRTDTAFQYHKQTSHSVEKQTDPCSLFDETENTTGEVKKGAISKSKKKCFSCRSCEMIFKSTDELHVHRKEKHTREIKIRTGPGPGITKHRRGNKYTCQICSKVFFHHLSLWAHTRKHPASPYSAIKSKSMPAKGSAKNCMSTEKPNTEDEKCVPNKTPVQDMSTEKNNDHKSAKCEEVPDVVEEEEVEFPCPSCPEVFSLHSQLKKHVELHQSALKRSKCSVCTSEMDSYKWPGSKKQRLYHCVPCQQGFSSLDSFLKHCQDHLKVRVEEDCLTEASTSWAS